MPPAGSRRAPCTTGSDIPDNHPITERPFMFTRSALAAAAIAFASVGAIAASDSPVHGARNDSAASGGTHKLVNVTENYAGATGIGLVAGFNNIDSPTTVNCTNTAGCTIISQAMVQIAPGSGALWAIC